ncbi:hypothetical protein [Mesorhizobium sangaii]|uniref:hypothetical protein n=1 Tax=Mesorhizobium sangaii TaxID=505389 RepID=UPI0016187B2D|nr:hypothetical protein [Mesorhizobium sangaii]
MARSARACRLRGSASVLADSISVGRIMAAVAGGCGLGGLEVGGGTAAGALGSAGVTGAGGGLVAASNCCGVRMSTDTRSSSSRLGRFGNGIRASVAASSVCRTTEAEPGLEA